MRIVYGRMLVLWIGLGLSGYLLAAETGFSIEQIELLLATDLPVETTLTRHTNPPPMSVITADGAVADIPIANLPDAVIKGNKCSSSSRNAPQMAVRGCRQVKRLKTLEKEETETETDKEEEERLEKNRQSARKGRLKKKHYIAGLEVQVKDLTKKNEDLCALLFKNKIPNCL